MVNQMMLPEETLFELASAAFDGELADVAASVGMSESEARETLIAWPRYAEIEAHFSRIRTGMRTGSELSELELHQLISNTRSVERRSSMRWLTAAAGLLLVFGGGYALTQVIDTTTDSSSSVQADRTLEEQSLSKMGAGAESLDQADAADASATGSAESETSSQTEALSPATATFAADARPNLGTFGTDDELAQALRTFQASLAGTAVSDSSRDLASSSSSQASPYAPACEPIATATVDGVFIGIRDAGASWEIVDVESCVVTRQLPKTPLP